MNFENANPKDWMKYVGKRRTFFKTKIGGREVKVRVHFKPKEESYITWYLAVKRDPSEEAEGKQWTTPWLRLKDWEQLGILSLVLSRFCIKRRYMNKESFKRIQAFKKRWKNLVGNDFKNLWSKKVLIRELEDKLLNGI